MTAKAQGMTRRDRQRGDGGRFLITPFINPSGEKVFKVDGYTRERARIRENYPTIQKAKCRALQLEAEYHASGKVEVPQVTSLSPSQLRAAEAAFALLGDKTEPEEMLRGSRYWIERGRDTVGPDHAPRLDDAQIAFLQWLERDSGLRPKTQSGLRHALRQLVRALGNVPLGEIDGDRIHHHIHGRPISKVAKDNEKRALSRFFSWCIERPRGWVRVNPCATVRTPLGPQKPPAIFDLEQVRSLLRATLAEKNGIMIPWVAFQLFGGLRPSEAERLDRKQWNAIEGEIRIGEDTKTERPRTVPINPTLRAWLDLPGSQSGEWLQRSFKRIKQTAGIRKWPQDVLRHTAASHLCNIHTSYIDLATMLGNSEGIIRKHYQTRVSKADTQAFFALRPEDFK